MGTTYFLCKIDVHNGNVNRVWEKSVYLMINKWNTYERNKASNNS